MPAATDSCLFPTHSPLPTAKRAPTDNDRRVLAGQLASYAHLRRRVQTHGPNGPVMPGDPTHLSTESLFDFAAHNRLHPEPLRSGVTELAEAILQLRAEAGQQDAVVAVAALAGNEGLVGKLTAPPRIDFSGCRSVEAIGRDLEAQLRGYTGRRTHYTEMARLALHGQDCGISGDVIEEAVNRLHAAAQGGNDLSARLIATVAEIQRVQASAAA